MRLTPNEIEIIRIHINAFKESLCNRGRWNEAQEYQDIVDKLDDLLTEPDSQGRWEVEENGEMCICSECRAVFDLSLGTGCFVNGDELPLLKYCPNCGSNMNV